MNALLTASFYQFSRNKTTIFSKISNAAKAIFRSKNHYSTAQSVVWVEQVGYYHYHSSNSTHEIKLRVSFTFLHSLPSNM